jgi:hypothetical protein
LQKYKIILKNKNTAPLSKLYGINLIVYSIACGMQQQRHPHDAEVAGVTLFFPG